MKTLPQKSVFAVLLLFLVTGFSAQYKADRRVVLPEGEVHQGWYFAAGGEVVIEGTVNGDVYAAGAMVEVSGTVNGDLLAAGGQVTVTGRVAEDIRAGGGTVRIEGNVGGSVTAAGGTVVIGKTGRIEDNLLAAGGSVRHFGEVLQEVMVTAGEMAVSGSVGRNLKFYGEELSVYEGSSIGGNVEATVSDSQRVSIVPGAVKGSVVMDVRRSEPSYGPSLGVIRVWGKTVYGLMLIVTALAAVLIFPRQVRSAGSMMTDHLGKTALWGIIGLVVIPVAGFLLLITLIGVPLGIFLIAIYLWFLFLSQLALPVMFGELITKDPKVRGWKLFWPIAVGVVLLQLLTAIPYLGFLLVLAGMILGLGALQILVSTSLKATVKK